ncbi:alpha/beta fold hydrolase [Mycobacteroides abscessus]|uniref:alpha/beta fold hydrolase n=1 Tax=Mycobacteroides abscessus TaxID=36809 RepID=UPI0009265B19|nr:alpha/beta hydrolase [Mycobacteroides abscessus]MBN7548399.1 alpha/beta hydrolase [Mycobacteroides abscessus subsp. abscessus]MDM2692277.1 alpha/beta hydrolase [Mycobacteroides abscessus]MDM2697089.1 alpha/beta hydrolase [Mycobacteroides abscessus]MDM2702187.1 alpha/beta hydrolase [Mycobacteroides abscessus]MDO3265688.1 alpha/beta hydrolase [Mycobacteroides abscessus subsp. abscessus]
MNVSIAPLSDQLAEVGRSISLCYDEHGDDTDPPVVLIPGLGQQLHCWPDDFVDLLVRAGLHVLRIDNRDVGRSTHMTYAPNPLVLLPGRARSRQYHLGDMACDTVGLLRALNLPPAHIVGMSMGGMIAQTIAAHFPHRIATLTSLMSMTGAPGVGRPEWSTWAKMLTGKPPKTREQAADAAVRMFKHIGSHGYPLDETWLREYAGVAWDRDPTSAGVLRQLAAIFISGDRTRELYQISAPTLVIHGDRDRMVHPSGAAATAAAITESRLEIIAGMSHDLPEQVRPEVAHHIIEHIRKQEIR